jgi:hypothetical protein
VVELGTLAAHLVDDEAFLSVRVILKVSDEILQLLDLGEFFLDAEVANLDQCLLAANSHVYSAQAHPVLHIHRVLLAFDSVKSLSSEHSAEHHHRVLTLPAVRQKEYTRTQI